MALHIQDAIRFFVSSPCSLNPSFYFLEKSVLYIGLVWIGSINSNNSGILEHTRMFLLGTLQACKIIISLWGSLPPESKHQTVRPNCFHQVTITWWMLHCNSFNYDIPFIMILYPVQGFSSASIIFNNLIILRYDSQKCLKTLKGITLRSTWFASKRKGLLQHTLSSMLLNSLRETETGEMILNYTGYLSCCCILFRFDLSFGGVRISKLEINTPRDPLNQFLSKKIILVAEKESINQIKEINFYYSVFSTSHPKFFLAFIQLDTIQNIKRRSFNGLWLSSSSDEVVRWGSGLVQVDINMISTFVGKFFPEKLCPRDSSTVKFFHGGFLHSTVFQSSMEKIYHRYSSRIILLFFLLLFYFFILFKHFFLA
ncbi:hypothetical protein VP01_2623g3 [Puccinia sorghi]|uniref:Uncharacterized protein n=1 Tax=Puccinia sorghi TaxID=27349 RepID=A0A0L6V4D8_9BASI|nr:hypothetical protein VP01_2623g3 [Puccinia sorghi]